MLAEYMMLGLEPGATDEQIRARYLELVKAHPPENDPQRFQDITCAYERLKDRRSRIRHRLFGYHLTTDVDGALAYLVRTAHPQPRRAGLQDLLKALQKT